MHKSKYTVVHQIHTQHEHFFLSFLDVINIMTVQNLIIIRYCQQNTDNHVENELTL